jgi:hypothetical protein
VVGIDATTVAKVIAENRTMSKLVPGGDEYEGPEWDNDEDRYEMITPGPATLEVGMTQADFSNKSPGAGGAIIISAWLTHRDKGALSVANVMGNCIGKEQLAKLQEIMRANPNLVSLCGIAGDATEADLTGCLIRAHYWC